MSRATRCDGCSHIDDGTRRLFRLRQTKGEGQLGKPLCPEVDICEGCLGIPLVRVIDDLAAKQMEEMAKEMGTGANTCKAETLGAFRPSPPPM